MNAAEWKEQGAVAEIGGRKIFTIADENDGEALLCLHGFPTSSFDYHKVWKGLSNHSSLYAFDMIGYGFSDKPADLAYTTNDQADLLEAVVEHFGIANTHIISHDYGNTIVQELLARRKDRGIGFQIDSLCFLNGALFPETHRPILAQKILIGPVGPLFGRLIPESAFARSLSSVFGKKTRPSKKELKEFVSIFRTNGGKKIAHKLIRYMSERETNRERWLDALSTIDFPFRFINGLDDPVSGRHLVTRFRELLPELDDIVELERIGHYPHFEAPESFLSLYGDFREKIRQKS
ncbi:MAG: alpha/beta hydrolase [Acidobacteria bacterium]|nr:MAG: alpha/beta hydrolase [Acidobacteriota bacterium]REJ99173.1 MAG: alpha/beta hydrolase [Acidobacteriota bacterium]REK16106.1 MAG: alpha/beta hydrolase [Acidobacteriota bacterium]REK43787.1 MAG: alpha/beta hydrolase [Acidobacteriota bacterium]